MDLWLKIRVAMFFGMSSFGILAAVFLQQGVIVRVWEALLSGIFLLMGIRERRWLREFRDGHGSN